MGANGETPSIQEELQRTMEADKDFRRKNAAARKQEVFKQPGEKYKKQVISKNHGGNPDGVHVNQEQVRKANSDAIREALAREQKEIDRRAQREAIQRGANKALAVAAKTAAAAKAAIAAGATVAATAAGVAAAIYPTDMGDATCDQKPNCPMK